MNQAIPNTIEAFFAQYKRKQFKKNERFIAAGEEPDGLYYLKSGVVKQVLTSADGDEFILNTYKPGSFVPLTWAVNGIPNRYDFVAMTKIETFLAPAKDVVAFLRTQPALLFDLVTRLISGLDAMLQKNGQLMQHSARSRLILVLLQFAARFGDGDASATGVSIKLPLTHRELATIAGLTRETVSVEMKKMEREHLLSDEHRSITLLNVQALQQQLK